MVLNYPPPPPPPPPRALLHLTAATPIMALTDPTKRRGKRRRILERLSRISSSPQLGLGEHYAADTAAAAEERAASCVSLCQRGSSSSSSSTTTVVEIPYGTQGECLRIQVPKPRRDLWEGLPDEVKVGVLRWLEPRELVRCSAVSKKWHALCFDGQLWSTLDATEYYNKIPVGELAKIVTTAGPFVKYLNLRGCVQLVNDWRIEAFWNAPRNLLTATLEGCALTRPSLQFLIQRNPSLVHLNLAGLPAVTNSICRHIAQFCPSLESLNVSWCTKANARGIHKIIDACKSLRELRACELAGFDDKAVMGAMWRGNTLERLHLAACPGLSDDAVRTLILGGPDPETDPFTGRPLAPPRRLVHLDVSRCKRVTDESLRCMAGMVPLLEGLELGGCVGVTDAGFAALLQTCGRLSHLDLEECAEITDATLVALARGPAARRMRSLGVGYCENVGDVGVKDVLRRCTGLRNLEMDNTRVTDAVLHEAAHAVRYRPPTSTTPHPTTSSPRIALRLVIYDCASITWPGIRCILARNVESASHRSPPPSPTTTTTTTNQPDLIQLKCFYGWQPTVDLHTRLVLRADQASLSRANRIEMKWAEHMGGLEEAGNGGRRRRRREAGWAFGGGEEEDDLGWGMAGGGRRRGGGGCVVS